MDTTIVVAVIGAVAAIAAAVIAKWPFGTMKPQRNTAPVTVQPLIAGPADDLEHRLEGDLDIQRLLRRDDWGRVARAAIAYHLRGEEPIDPNWKKRGAWVQVTEVARRLRQ